MRTAIEHELYARDRERVYRFHLELQLGNSQCVVLWGTHNDVSRLVIKGYDDWQALMLGVETLKAEVESILHHEPITLHRTEDEANSGSSPLGISELFWR